MAAPKKDSTKITPTWGVDLTKWASSDADRLDDATRAEGNLDAKAVLEAKRQAAVNNGGKAPAKPDEDEE